MKIELEVNDTVAGLLAVLSPEGKPEEVIEQLIDHAQQGVYRPGSWERPWLEQAFGHDWQAKLESGCPYGRPNGYMFERPIKAA